MAQWVENLTGIHQDTGLILSLYQWVKGSGVAMSSGVGRRHGSDPVLLWVGRQIQLQFDPQLENLHMPRVQA